MIDLVIPEHLRINNASTRPIAEVAAELYEKGYELVSEGQDIVAKEICSHSSLKRGGGHWHCKCGKVFTDKELGSINHLQSIVNDDMTTEQFDVKEAIDHPAWDIPCDVCGRRVRQCVCDKYNLNCDSDDKPF